MTHKTLLSLSMAAIMSVSIAPKTFAQPVISSSHLTQNQVTVIPKSTAIVVTFPNTLDLDISHNHSLTLPLAQPIVDRRGNVLVPQYSPVMAELVISEDKAAIVAKAIVINGKVVPIEATSPLIPSTKITLESGREKAKKNIAPFGTLFSSFVGAIDGDFKTEYQAGKGGIAIGIITGLASPKKVRVVSLPQGSIQVLTLQRSVNLSNINQI